ncbi:MAG: PilZ domain-containing protein [Candidatus Eisenbacteria bacterium]|uniref:PilZ domain-containing protein n=1 Tax=Eiseniibacteriota bacterium TaxID=2212470 RepID=A0A956M271_UNCEI|nr:PilZ domain-containing protein [Candidatus Eisenbacteria bacterium]
MSGPNARPERRKHRRAQIQLEAILEGEKPGDEVRLEVLNFSVGGFFCRINRPMEPMTKLGIEFVFPPFADESARRIETVALVVRCEPAGRSEQGHRMGACFLELSKEDRTHIQAYVDWYQATHVPETEAEAV